MAQQQGQAQAQEQEQEKPQEQEPSRIIDRLVQSYANNKNLIPEDVDKELRDQVIESVKEKVIAEAYEQFTQEQINEAKDKAKIQHKRTMEGLTIKLVVETMFLATAVGVIVNQISFWIPKEIGASIGATIIALLFCVVALFLVKSDSKE